MARNPDLHHRGQRPRPHRTPHHPTRPTRKLPGLPNNRSPAPDTRVPDRAPHHPPHQRQTQRLRRSRDHQPAHSSGPPHPTSHLPCTTTGTSKTDRTGSATSPTTRTTLPSPHQQHTPHDGHPPQPRHQHPALPRLEQHRHRPTPQGTQPHPTTHPPRHPHLTNTNDSADPPPEPGGPPRRQSNGAGRRNLWSAWAVDNFVG